MHAFPYNGGYLDRKQFSMIEYCRAGTDTPLTCVLLIRQPKLSEIEREALRLVPSDSSANNIAPRRWRLLRRHYWRLSQLRPRPRPGWLYNEFVNCTLPFSTAVTTLSPRFQTRCSKVKTSKDKLKSLPPEVTAAELLRLRADILLQTPPK